MRWILASTIIAGLVLSSCDGKFDEAKQAMDNLETMAKSGDNMQEVHKAAEKRRQERRERGDTLSMPYAELQKLLPTDISGYTAQEPEGSNSDMPGFSMGQASRRYEKPDGSYVTISLTDWNASEVGWTGATALFALQYRSDNSTENSGSFQTEDPLVNGSDRFGKQDKNANVTYALGARFLLVVDANNQSDVNFVKSVSERLDLKKLSKM